MRKFSVLVAVIFGFALGACAKPSKPPVCVNTAAKTCTLYTGASYSDATLQATISARCLAVSGSTFAAAGECQTGVAIASCTRNSGRAFEQVDKHFTGSTQSAAVIEAACVAEGALFR